jgi:polar amino acid transport system substrate-binding protein
MRTRIIASLGILVAVATACSSSSNQANQSVREAFATPSTTTPAPPTTTTPPPCNPRQSERPDGPLPTPGQMPAGSYMDEIRSHGHLTVGVDQNTLLWGFRDPITAQIDGLDVALAREIATAIFGTPEIQLRAVVTGNRTDVVKYNEVDMVASQITVNCTRRQDVDLSTVYYDAYQGLLVRRKGPVQSLADLDGRRVCATKGSTSILRIKEVAPKAVIYPVAARIDCLVALQQGRVDAITSDNTILLGFEIQDPENTQLLADNLEDEPYGLATSKDHPEFGRFVNAVLDQLRANGRLEALYHQYLDLDRPELNFTAPATPPSAEYLTS